VTSGVRARHGWQAEFDAAVALRMHRLTEDVADDARRACPEDTGALVGSIHTQYVSATHSRVWVGTDHWWPTEYGSHPHEIRPKAPDGWLVFWWEREGRWVKTKLVHHPGTPAQPFMRPALLRIRAL
jgi:hypothetical protein